MEDVQITEPGKSKATEVKFEKDAHFSFLCSTIRAPGISSCWTDCQSGILLGVFERLRENLQRKSPELRRSGDWFLHHDNAPSSHSCL
jgi:hypothetical protein